MAIRIPELNEVLLTGRLTRDADNRMTQRGQSYSNFSIAVGRRYLDNASGEWKEETAFIDVTLWTPSDSLKEKLRKGVPVMVQGRLVMSEFTDKNGLNRKVLRVTARRVQIFQADAMPQSDSAAGDIQEPSEVAEDDVPF